jgi:hypothetical protein
LQAYFVQRAGFGGIIVYDNIEDEPLVTMGSDGDVDINIFAVFVSARSGVILADLAAKYGDWV